MNLVSKTNRVRAVREMARKLCNICNKRPVDRAADVPDMCFPCAEEGGWENTHGDRNHDGLIELLATVMETEKDRTGADAYKIGAVELRKLAPKAGVKNAAKFKSAELRAEIVRVVEVEQAGCWICHPELNQAQKVTKGRAASTGERPSRAGQVINVPLRASGVTKAAVVTAKAPKDLPAVVKTEDLWTTLEITAPDFTIVLVWNPFGNYDYLRSSFTANGTVKRIRNVAEALRLLNR